jgi:hypothetical protein
LTRAAIFLHIFLLSKTSTEIPPVPPFEKGGRRGDLRRPFQKAKFIQKIHSKIFEISIQLPPLLIGQGGDKSKDHPPPLHPLPRGEGIFLRSEKEILRRKGGKIQRNDAFILKNIRAWGK